MRKIITFGTFDLFHVGHLRILERARLLGDHLTVGVSTDALNLSKKSVYPVFNERERSEIVSALRCVDEVFLEESLEKKAYYINRYDAGILVMGDDWAGKFDHLNNICKVVYLPRTEGISTTSIKSDVRTAA